MTVREGVWTHGRDTTLQAWIAGESRTIVITSEAIEHYLKLGPARAADVTAAERRKFVEGHVALVIAAANRKAEPSDHAAEPVMIRKGDL
jgi:hypothetical protein